MSPNHPDRVRKNYPRKSQYALIDKEGQHTFPTYYDLMEFLSNSAGGTWTLIINHGFDE